MQEPYIKLFLSILDWGWHKEPETLSFWIHALCLASHPDKKYKTLIIKRGQFTGTLNEWSFVMGLSVRQVRTAIERLTSTGEITAESPTKHYTLITICNYERYQSIFASFDKPTTNQRQTIDTSTTDQRQSNDNQTTSKIRIIENKEYNINNNKQQQSEPQFFKTFEECKEYLQSKGRSCSDAGIKKFFEINQQGTRSTAPYWYKDGVVESFDNFISIERNRKKYLEEPKGTKSPQSSGAPPGVPLWQRSPHEYWNRRIGVLSKSDTNLGNVLAKLEFVGNEGNVFYYTQKSPLSEFDRKVFNSALPSVAAEFRGVNLQYKPK